MLLEFGYECAQRVEIDCRLEDLGGVLGPLLYLSVVNSPEEVVDVRRWGLGCCFSLLRSELDQALGTYTQYTHEFSRIGSRRHGLGVSRIPLNVATIRPASARHSEASDPSGAACTLTPTCSF